MVYKNTLATVQHQIQQAENPSPAVVIRMDAAPVYNHNLLDYLTSEVALEQSVIRSTDPHIPIDNNCMDDKLHFGIPKGSRDDKNQVDKSDEHDAIPTTSRRQRATSDLMMFDLETSDVEGYGGDDGDNGLQVNS